MATNYKQPGNVIPFTAGANLVSGAGVLIGTRVGVCLNDVASGAVGQAQLTGVFNLPKLSTDAVTIGALLYWDDTNKRLTTTSAGNTLAGFAWAASGSGTATVDIKLNA